MALAAASFERQGANHFRVVTFQYLHNANKKIIEGVTDYDTNADKKLSLEEFLLKGLGNYIDFGRFNVNHDGQLDDSQTRTRCSRAINSSSSSVTR